MPPTRRRPSRSGRRRPSSRRPIKGWTLGPEIEARNATHQIKKMTKEQLRVLRARLSLQDEIPDARPRHRRAALLPTPGGLPGAGVPQVPGPGPRWSPAPPDGAGQGAHRASRTFAGGLRRVHPRVPRPAGLDDDGLRPVAPQLAPRPRHRASTSSRSCPTRAAPSVSTPFLPR